MILWKRETLEVKMPTNEMETEEGRRRREEVNDGKERSEPTAAPEAVGRRGKGSGPKGRERE